MRATFTLVLVWGLLSGCVALPRPLTEKESELAAFLVAHGFVRESPADYSRSYSSLALVQRDFSLADQDFIVPPNGPALGPEVSDVRVFSYRGLGFVVTGDKGRDLRDPTTACVVVISFDQVSAGTEEYPKGRSQSSGRPVAPAR